MPSDNRNAQKPKDASAKKPTAALGDAFVKHLEHASSVVQTWPAWKQEILGGTSSQIKSDGSTNKRHS